MIRYKSTRGNPQLLSFSQSILKGIADDGGLYVPQTIPKLTQSMLNNLINVSYQKRALAIFQLFSTDIEDDTLRNIVLESYSHNFDNSHIAPIYALNDKTNILELWHGPTLAFKDMALQIMPLFFQEAVRKDNLVRKKQGKKPLQYLILVATSGDTGKAALEGFKNEENISAMVFYPKDGVSKLQELSMLTQEGENVAVFGVQGNFDAIQSSLKETFADKDFNTRLLNQFQINLSSANSINWGRVLPQIVYHISAYVDLVKQKLINQGDQVDIAVPTGNFGNILAAYYAKKMGLPIRRLICASNENNVLTEFLRTGVYDISHRLLKKTPSPSMDIIVSSNIERLLYEITMDSNKVSKWVKQLKGVKRFKVDARTREVLRDMFFADWVTNEQCLSEVKKTWEKDHYLIDPHTAVAKVVADRYVQDSSTPGESIPVVICSTAHWAKFASAVYRALFDKDFSEEESNMIDQIASYTRVSVPHIIYEWQTKSILHSKTCKIRKEAIEQIILSHLVSLCYL